MARGTTLANLVIQLRHELSRSIATGAGADEDARFKHILKRTQEFWYDEYAWRHLQAQRPITTVVNQRFYAFPSDMNVEEVEGIFIRDGGNYLPISRGITFQDYATHDSFKATSATGSIDITAGTSSPGTNKVSTITVDGVDILTVAVDWVTSHAATATAVAVQINAVTTSPDYSASASGATITVKADIIQGDTPNTFVVGSTVGGDVTTGNAVAMANGVDSEQADPVRKWDILEEIDYTGAAVTKIEVLPVPETADTLVLIGKRSLSALAVDADTADLDDQLIVRTVAAEMTAREKKRDSEAHSAAAQARFTRLKSRQNAGSGPFSMLGQPKPPHGVDIVVTG